MVVALLLTNTFLFFFLIFVSILENLGKNLSLARISAYLTYFWVVDKDSSKAPYNLMNKENSKGTLKFVFFFFVSISDLLQGEHNSYGIGTSLSRSNPILTFTGTKIITFRTYPTLPRS